MSDVRQLRCVRLNFRFVRKDVEGSLLLYAVIRCFGLLFLYHNISADMIVIKYKYSRDRDCLLQISWTYSYFPLRCSILFLAICIYSLREQTRESGSAHNESLAISYALCQPSTFYMARTTSAKFGLRAGNMTLYRIKLSKYTYNYIILKA